MHSHIIQFPAKIRHKDRGEITHENEASKLQRPRASPEPGWEMLHLQRHQVSGAHSYERIFHI